MKAISKELHLLWLSHVLNENTPLYGGGKDIHITQKKSILNGDSCNTSILNIPNHAGSHVDCPHHFIQGGITIDAYTPEEWIFSNPLLLDVPTKSEQVIIPNDLPAIECQNENIDLVLIRTGFEAFRGSDIFWQDGPVLLSELATYLCKRYPSLRAVGIDAISVSSLHHREAGCAVHQAFLSNNIRLFEDLSLSCIRSSLSLRQVIALPLRFFWGDGAPCTVIGWEDKY